MDQNEIITLSSDDESDFTHQFEQNTSMSIKSCFDKIKAVNAQNNANAVSYKNKEVQIVKLPKNPKQKKKNFKLIKKKYPEVVDLVDSSEKLTENEQVQLHSKKNDKSPEAEQNHISVDVIDIDEASTEKDISHDTEIKQNDSAVEFNLELPANNIDVNKEVTSDFKSLGPNSITDEEGLWLIEANDAQDQNLQFFTEFVEFCGYLEEIPSDRARLTQKLMKRYGEANAIYIKSQEFKDLIQKCKVKVNKNNLYLIAKEVTDELSYRKKDTGKSNKEEEKCQSKPETIEKTKKPEENGDKLTKKRKKIINKIIKKLDKLGCMIRELEQKEVDLSDEEESSYVQVQRCRERFCQIYSKLCKYTNEVPFADHVHSRKICFTESKYPAINRCIENWLNKTKRFPDFSDIMKLLESQSSSLGLPSNRESVRVIAIEIFQQVGAMLQRRRKYDLWDSFCGFLDEGEDPAVKDPLLDKVLKKNFEIRVKKEQEIFQHFAELQDKERLEPEEVPDEEANRSPVESGNEDEKEIEDIENSMNRRLDDEIKKETEENGITLETVVEDDGENLPINETQDRSLANENDNVAKESKNNYKNCKSLKWKLENGMKGKSESVNLEDSGTCIDNEKEREQEKNGEDGLDEVIETESKDGCLESTKGDETDFRVVTKADVQSGVKKDAVGCFESPSKRKLDAEKGDDVYKKAKLMSDKENDNQVFDVFESDEEFETAGWKTKEVFEVRCCHIFTDNIFEELEREKKKDWGKRKVFRDLTNVSRLMEVHGRKRRMSGLFSQSLFYRNFCEFDKPYSKKRFKMNFRLVGSKGIKCGLSQEKKSEKTVRPDTGGDSDEKDIQDSSERGGSDEGDNFFSEKGNGNEDDNNGEGRKKKGRTDDEMNENQLEDEDDDDEEENETEREDNKVDAGATEHSVTKEKTDESAKVAENLNEIAEEDTSFGTEVENKKEKEESFKNEETPNQIKEKKVSCVRKRSASKFSKRKDKTNIKSTEVRKVVADEETSKNPLEPEISEVTVIKENKTETEIDEVIVETVEMKSKTSEKEKDNDQSVGKPEEDVEIEVQPPSTGKTDLKVKNKQTESRRKVAEVRKTSSVTKECLKPERKKRTFEIKPTSNRKSVPVDPPGQRQNRKSAPSTSDEERVKRFLLHSPSSISIIPPKKLTLTKPPSQAALQALATLRNLKGISATIVRGGGKPKSEDDVVVLGTTHRRTEQSNPVPGKRKRSEDLPVISSVQSVGSTTPKIVTVEGNVSGFENTWQETTNNSQCDSSSIRISNVWGSYPYNLMQDEAGAPGCSFRQNDSESRDSVKKKGGKKAVEYVVLE